MTVDIWRFDSPGEATVGIKRQVDGVFLLEIGNACGETDMVSIPSEPLRYKWVYIAITVDIVEITNLCLYLAYWGNLIFTVKCVNSLILPIYDKYFSKLTLGGNSGNYFNVIRYIGGNARHPPTQHRSFII